MKDFLRDLGAKKNEGETYLRLLELGAQPASVIAKHIGTPRSTMYLILQALENLGLVEEFERSGVKYFKTVDVSEIENVINARKRSLDQTMIHFKEKLPELELLQKKLTMTPKTKLFEGKDKVMQMYEQVLKEESFSALFNAQLMKEVMPQYYEKIPQALKKQGGKARELLVDNAVAHEYMEKFESERHQMKVLPLGTDLQSDMIICKEKIFLISFGKSDLSAVEIYNSSLAKSHQSFFNLLWG
ncbi:MAG: helix-turn-helix domain-containing protein [Candidatus Gracilibacteria bacterium]|nr:helix-turn-helix domain-containing protein [Candidatus Gracilibacteria bacterium]